MRFVKVLLTLLLMIGLTALVSYLWRALPVVSAYGAKNLCSCVFVAGRSPGHVIQNELNYSFMQYGSFEVDFNDSTATGNVFGLASRTAVYREKIGCTLVIGSDLQTLKNQPYKQIPVPQQLSDTLEWPLGRRLTNSIPSNFNMKRLQAILNDAIGDTYGKNTGTRGIVVSYGGKLIAEKYAAPFDEKTPQLGWSMTKSITNALIGIKVKEGLLEVNNQAPITFWNEDNRGEIKLDDLMRMSSGLEWEEKYGGVSTATEMLFKSNNTGLYAAEQPLAYPPGSHWYYSSGTTNILSYILRNLMPQEEYFKYPYISLFHKVGATTAVIEPDASGTYVGSSFMYATPRDWTRFGLLYLNDGVWNGERVLPEGWVDYSIKVTEGSKGKYGAQFWLNADNVRYPDVPEDTYLMSGFQGQNVVIIPSYNMVITRLAYDPEERFDMNKFLADILNCVNI